MSYRRDCLYGDLRVAMVTKKRGEEKITQVCITKYSNVEYHSIVAAVTICLM